VEETGAAPAGTAPLLVGVDVHPIPRNKRERSTCTTIFIFAFRACSEQVPGPLRITRGGLVPA